MAELVVDADDRVHMATPDGRHVLVPVAEIQEAYAAGRVPMTPEQVEQGAKSLERGGLGQRAIALGESAARGLTLGGGSDVAGAAILGPEWAKAARERQEENPLTSIVGEAGGVVAGGLLSSGESLLARGLSAPTRFAARAGSLAARGTEGALGALGYRGTTAAGRLAAKALSVGTAGATEGALWGAGSAASRAALEGRDITAEKLLAGAAEGAELGGIFGAGLGAGEHFLGAAARKAASAAGLEGGIGGIGARLRDRATLRAVGFRRGDVRKLGRTTEQIERKVAELSEDVREYRFRGSTRETAELKGASLWERAGKPEEIAADLTLARREIGSELGALRQKIDDATRATGPAARVNELGLKNATFLRSGMRQDSVDFARRIYDGADAARAEQIATNLADPVQVRLFPDGTINLGDGRHRLAAAEQAGARHIRARIESWDEIGNVTDLGEHAVSLNPERLGPDIGPMLTRIDEEVIAPLRESMLPDIRRRGARVERAFADLRARHASGDPVSFGELERFKQQLDESFRPPPPTGGGIQAPPQEHAAALQQAERIVIDAIDDAAVASMRRMGADPSDYLELKRQFGALRDLEGPATRAASDEAARGLTSPWERILGFGGAIGAMASGNIGALAAGIGGAAASRILQNYGDRALVRMLDVVSHVDDTVSATAKALVGTEKPTKGHAAIPIIGAKAVEAYERARDSLNELEDNPREMMGQLARLTDRYGVEYPGAAAAVQAAGLRQINAIRAAMPTVQNRAVHSLTPQHEDPIVGIQEIHVSMGKIRGITQPRAVIADLGAGKLDLRAIEGLEEASPLMFAELRQNVIREAAEAGDSLPYRRRMLLGLAFDFPADYSMTPEGAAALIGIAPPPAEEAPAPGQTAPSQPDPNLTTTQRLETTL